MFIFMLATLNVGGQAQSSDLKVTSADISFSNDSPESGEIINIDVRVQNLGPSAASNVVVTFSVSGVPLPPTKTIAAIPSGGSGQTSHQWITPLAGTYTIRVTVDGDQDDPVTDNNMAEKNITVGPAVPTITVSAEAEPDTIQSEGLFWVNGSAEMGGEPVNGGDVDVQITETGTGNTSVTNSDGTFAVHVRGPVEQRHYEVRVSVTMGAVTGSTTLNITVLQPDLQVNTLTITPADAKEGDSVKVRIGVQNIGNGTAKAVKVALNLDDQFEKEFELGDLVNGQTQSLTYSWKAKTGSHSFQVVADPDDSIDEIKENNNMKAETIEVKKKEEKPTPSFEMVLFIISVVVLFMLMRNGDGYRSKGKGRRKGKSR
jgi:subtilase family serine protease